jgi:hypothetical protein
MLQDICKFSNNYAKDLETGRISYLHKDDYKVTIRPSVISWRINHEYLDVISDFDANLCFENFISPDFNRSWKDLHIFADLNCFYDLDDI